jgi:hypothetical protein
MLAVLVTLLVAGSVLPAGAQSPQSAHNTQPFNVVPLTINSVAVVNGQLVALGSLGSHPFASPISLAAQPAATPGTCPILNLSLAPIQLNLLGLNVNTSAICLNITAISGSGNLLGNLLCGIAGSLNGGVPLGTILSGLSAGDLTTLTNGLATLLNGVLAEVTSSSQAAGAACNILNLSLGPVNLNLLGLNVHLDNCANGPVTVTVTANPGPGQLLGNLLCDLGNLLNNGHANPRAIYVTLRQVAQAIQSLL